MSDFNKSRTRLVRHTFAGLSDDFKAVIQWSDVLIKLENGNTQDVLYTLEAPVMKIMFPLDVPTLRYIASILRCNSAQDLAILQDPGVIRPFIPTAEHVLRNLGYERQRDW